MFSKQEAKSLREAFWTGFGKITRPHLSSGGYRVNWVNYRTGIKGVSFHLWATPKKCGFAIDVEHPSMDIRELQWEQLLELKKVIESETGPLIWEPLFERENGKVISRAYLEIDGVNVYDNTTWPRMMPLLKKGIFGLDRFWVNFGDIFQVLQ
ncbi:MAG: hypothetical protein ACI9YL_001202 [Luteibaculaceae bacterium]|jgi:hypothetical protein